VGGTLTAAAGGFLIWSGLDTNAKRKAFDHAPTQANKDDGDSRQLRTNIAIGVTAGLGVATAVTAFLVDRQTDPKRVGRRIWGSPFAALDGSAGLVVGGDL
jgi:hypothetical protein